MLNFPVLPTKKFIPFFFALFSIFTANVFSQAICPIETLEVNKVSGKILDGGRLATPLSDIKVELRKTNDEETLISTTTTDKSGLFEFKDIKKGKYIFIVYFVFGNSLYLKYHAVVKVKKSNSTKSKPSIIISFGGDCWKTEATTVK